MIKNNSDLNINFSLCDTLNMYDIYTIAIFSIYTFFAILFFNKIPDSANLIYTNVIIGIVVISLSFTSLYVGNNIFFKLARIAYIIPVIYIAYSQIQEYIKILNPIDYDNFLIQCDKIIFGLNPTQWITQYSNPYLTEYFQFSYMLFFLLPLIHAIDLYYSQKSNELNILIRNIAFSYYFSYLMYLFLPAIGPRFTLHEFMQLNNELPGLFLTPYFRDFVNVGGSVPIGAINPADLVNRDCMPSGHTWITLVNIYWAFKFKPRMRWFIYVFGFSLILSTIYLRYHYVIDVIVGIVFAIFAILIEPRIRELFKKNGFKNV